MLDYSTISKARRLIGDVRELAESILLENKKFKDATRTWTNVDLEKLNELRERWGFVVSYFKSDKELEPMLSDNFVDLGSKTFDVTRYKYRPKLYHLIPLTSEIDRHISTRDLEFDIKEMIGWCGTLERKIELSQNASI